MRIRKICFIASFIIHTLIMVITFPVYDFKFAMLFISLTVLEGISFIIMPNLYALYKQIYVYGVIVTGILGIISLIALFLINGLNGLTKPVLISADILTIGLNFIIGYLIWAALKKYYPKKDIFENPKQ